MVDDGSSDPRVGELRRAHPEVRWLALPHALGFGPAANRGLAAATGDPLVLLNSDAEVLPGGDQALLAAFASEPDLGAVGARLAFPDGRPQWSGGRLPTLAWCFALASGLGPVAGRWRRRLAARGAEPPANAELPWLPGTALALRRAAWEQAGPFDEGYAFYAQDLELSCRLAAAGWRLRLDDGFRARHHLGGSIAAGAAAPTGQRLDLLWRDLVRWGERQRGARFARQARRALLAGGRLRRFALALRGARAGAERAAVERALGALEELRPAVP